MPDLIFPTDLRVTTSKTETVSNAAVSRSIFTGAARTVGRSGKRWRFGIATTNASNLVANKERARLKSFAASLDGPATRFWFTPPGYVQRGSFPAPELLTNNTFANGATGWTAYNSVMTASDRTLRATSSGASTAYGILIGAAATQYVAYIYRSNCSGAYSLGADYLIRAQIGDGVAPPVEGVPSAIATPGFSSKSLVSLSTALQLYSYTSSGIDTASRYVDINYTSLSRCFLIDNGANLLTYSDQFDNAAWVKVSASCAANVAVAPDGTSTADSIVENSTTAYHYFAQSITVSSTASDYSVSVVVKASARSFVNVQLSESGGSAVTQFFNLSTGAVGSTGSTGANWSNRRSFISSAGNGWYICTVVARKTNATTTVNANVISANSDGGDFYLGTGATALFLWRATVAQSSVPTRLVQTTSAAVAATAQTGSNLYVKGLPASTSGLLLAGDMVQIGNQLQQLTASLDSDAAGLGYLQMHRALRSSPADNDPVIVNQPMGRFMLTDQVSGWTDSPGGLSDVDFMFEEAMDT